MTQRERHVQKMAKLAERGALRNRFAVAKILCEPTGVAHSRNPGLSDETPSA